MAKIKGKVTLKNNSSLETNIIDIKGINNKNHFSYKENNILVTIDILDNKIVMNRKTSEYNLNLNLEENKITKNKYNIKNIGMLLLDIKTSSIKIDNNCLILEYLVIDSNELFSYKLEYEKMED